MSNVSVLRVSSYCHVSRVLLQRVSRVPALGGPDQLPAAVPLLLAVLRAVLGGDPPPPRPLRQEAGEEGHVREGGPLHPRHLRTHQGRAIFSSRQ